MRIKSDDWLGEVIGRSAFRVDVEATDTDARALVEHAALQRRAFYFSKVDARNVAGVRLLSSAGAFVADVNVVFERLRPSQAKSPQGVTVHPIEASEADAILAVTGSAFQFSRFHLDPLFSDETANKIKREWVRSYVEKRRGDTLFAALVDGKPVGFLAALVAESHGRKLAVIDLIAVDKQTQRRGAGVALIEAFAAHYRGRVDALQVGTQVANLPSVRFYEGLGFALVQSQDVMHLHVENGKVL